MNTVNKILILGFVLISIWMSYNIVNTVNNIQTQRTHQIEHLIDQM